MNYRAALLIFTAALLLGASQADAARPLLAELLARAPAKASEPAKQPIMGPLPLEACLRTAQELDVTGTAIGYQIAAIEHETAEAMFLENQINAEILVLGGYDEPGVNAFQKRVIRHAELAKKFKAEFPVHRQKKKAYDAAVAEFDRDCARGFTAPDLGAAKAKLGIR